ncbi:MAG: fructose-bisphosphatase class III [Lachnospiraceae bacterium]|nr:fructose-bisphosphatase class III [Lachnospiraceae bacterium]
MPSKKDYGETVRLRYGGIDKEKKNLRISEADDMRYIVSDIHGCYVQYQMLLKKIHFTENDKLYVLGDVVDRGPEPIKVLQDMMRRRNVIFILGNHDFIMYALMTKLSAEITSDNYDKHLKKEILSEYNLWCQDGGQITAEQFGKLNYSEKLDMLDYIAEASLYEVIENDGKEYRLVHAGLTNFSPDKDLNEYGLYDFLEERVDYSKRYYPDETVFLVTGHTPTILIKGWEKPEVYRENGHIAMDCSCAAGGKLAAFCIETEEVIYVNGI